MESKGRERDREIYFIRRSGRLLGDGFKLIFVKLRRIGCINDLSFF